jgi:NDP-sugar pyrophosphorylase family protein
LPNPLTFFNKYVTNDIIACSNQLEVGKLDYKSHEKVVKYETIYEQVAHEGQMVAVKHSGYWSDSGTEEAMAEIERCYRPS